MGEKVKIRPTPEKHRITTALPIQSSHSETVRIRKKQANESVPEKNVIPKGS